MKRNLVYMHKGQRDVITLINYVPLLSVVMYNYIDIVIIPSSFSLIKNNILYR